MPTKLKSKIAKHPSPAAALAAKEIRPSRRMLRAIFCTSRRLHPHGHPTRPSKTGSRSTPTGVNATATARIRRARELTRASCLVLLCERLARYDCAGRCRTASVAGRLETGPVGGANIG